MTFSAPTLSGTAKKSRGVSCEARLAVRVRVSRSGIQIDKLRLKESHLLTQVCYLVLEVVGDSCGEAIELLLDLSYSSREIQGGIRFNVGSNENATTLERIDKSLI